MKRVRDFIERLLYTGMKPSAPQHAPGDGMRWLGPLRGPVDRFLSGGPSPSDPLYLTRRTVSQKVLRWGAIGVPFAAMVILLFLAAAGQFSTPPQAKREIEPSTSATRLPSFDNVQIKMNRDVAVLEARVDSIARPVTLSGSVKNIGDRRIQSADINFELTDKEGSQVGGYTVTVENLAPKETTKFHVSLPMPGAVTAMIREVTTR